jgi:hypothetical protein
MEACGMSDDAAPNAGHSKPSLREMLRQAVANTANLKITKCVKELNNLGHRTQKGSQWDSNSVGALLGRQAALNRRSDSASVGQKVI